MYGVRAVLLWLRDKARMLFYKLIVIQCTLLYFNCVFSLSTVHGISKETTTTTSTTTTTTATTTPVPTTTTSTKAVKIEEPDEFDDYQDACSADEFQCKSDLGICLPKALVCDGTKDCPNSEDETDCPSGRMLIKLSR